VSSFQFLHYRFLSVTQPYREIHNTKLIDIDKYKQDQSYSSPEGLDFLVFNWIKEQGSNWKRGNFIVIFEKPFKTNLVNYLNSYNIESYIIFLMFCVLRNMAHVKQWWSFDKLASVHWLRSTGTLACICHLGPWIVSITFLLRCGFFKIYFFYLFCIFQSNSPYYGIRYALVLSVTIKISFVCLFNRYYHV
jgi:hypothetical protein